MLAFAPPLAAAGSPSTQRPERRKCQGVGRHALGINIEGQSLLLGSWTKFLFICSWATMCHCSPSQRPPCSPRVDLVWTPPARVNMHSRWPWARGTRTFPSPGRVAFLPSGLGTRGPMVSPVPRLHCSPSTKQVALRQPGPQDSVKGFVPWTRGQLGALFSEECFSGALETKLRD